MSGVAVFLAPDVPSGAAYPAALALGFLRAGYSVDWFGAPPKALWNLIPGGDPAVTPALPDFAVSNLNDGTAAVARKPDIVVVAIGLFERLPPSAIDVVTLAELADRLAGTDVPVVLLDHRDEPPGGLHYRCWPPVPVRLLAVREHPDDVGRGVVSFDPMAAFPHWRVPAERDLFLSSTLVWRSRDAALPRGDRRAVARALAGQFEHSLVLGDGEQIERGEYYRTLSRSLISVTHWGYGYSCKRDWEILACGAVLAVRRLPTPHLEAFLDMHSCVTYESPGELVEKLSYLQSRARKIDEMRRRSQEIVASSHRPEHRARRLLALLTERDDVRFNNKKSPAA